jgi:hypothetical protein
MSYRDPGDSYVPPPPPKPRRSPWMFVGIGCGVLTLLVVGMFGLLAYKINQEIKNSPFDLAANRRAMGDTPIYPGSELDEEMTRAQYVTLKMGGGIFGSLKADSIVTETRLTGEPIEDVQDYYWKVMIGRRYKSIPQPEIMGARSVLYRKGTDALLVQVQAVPKLGGNAIVLMRFTNFKDDIGEEVEEPTSAEPVPVVGPPREVKERVIVPTVKTLEENGKPVKDSKKTDKGSKE